MNIGKSSIYVKVTMLALLRTIPGIVSLLRIALVAFILVGCAAGVPTAPPSDGIATTPAVAVESPPPAPSPTESPPPTLSPTESPAPRYTEVEFAADGGP